MAISISLALMLKHHFYIFPYINKFHLDVNFSQKLRHFSYGKKCFLFITISQISTISICQNFDFLSKFRCVAKSSSFAKISSFCQNSDFLPKLTNFIYTLTFHNNYCIFHMVNTEILLRENA